MSLKNEIKNLIDSKTKPIGSLGLLENIAYKIIQVYKNTLKNYL